MRLLLLFTAVPLLELVLLVKISQVTSFWFTLGLVLTTGIVGAWLAHRQGWATLERIRRELAAGQMPGAALIDALLIFVAGALLITPGVLTDAVGFALLIPGVRRTFRERLTRRFRGSFSVRTYGFDPRRDVDAQVVTPHDPRVIDVTPTEHDSRRPGR